MRHNSIYELFLEHVDKRGDRSAIMAKVDGKYRDFTWKQVGDEVRQLAAGLVTSGVQAGDRVCVVSQTRREWILFDLAILAAGGVTVPIYPSNLADECQYITANCEATFVITEDAAQTQKFRAERARLPLVKKVLQLTGDVPAGDDWVVGFDAWKAATRIDEKVLEERRKHLNRDSIVTIIYTSGTTGRPKGAVLTHDNLLYEAEAIAQIDLLREGEIHLLWVPLAHVLGKVLVVAWLATPHVLAIAESLQTVKDNLGETRPSVMAGVPRLYEKFHAAVVQKGLAAGGTKAKLFTRAIVLSEKNGEAEMKGESLPLRDAIEFAVLKRLVFKKIGKGLSEILGGRMRVLISGGAPLSPKIAWFFRDAGLKIQEGYGLTETSAASFVNRRDNIKIGTVGLPMPGTQVRIAEDGEILIKGRGVMREYWKNPEATREVLDSEAWLHTGDIGVIEDGLLRITDRKKDIIVTAGGKNVAPQNIEGALKAACPYISQVMVHGDKRQFLSALITLIEETGRAWAESEGKPYKTVAELAASKEMQTLIDEAVKKLNASLASFETIKKYKILSTDFSQDAGELTPTLKVKRKFVSEKHKATLDAFYSGGASSD